MPNDTPFPDAGGDPDAGEWPPLVPRGTPIRISEAVAPAIVPALAGIVILALHIWDPRLRPPTPLGVVQVVLAVVAIVVAGVVCVHGIRAYRDLTESATRRFRRWMAIAAGVVGLMIVLGFGFYGAFALAGFGYLLAEGDGARAGERLAGIGVPRLERLVYTAAILAAVAYLARPIAFGLESIPLVIACYFFAIGGSFFAGFAHRTKTLLAESQRQDAD